MLDPAHEWADGLRFTEVAGTSGLKAALTAEIRGEWSTDHSTWIVRADHPQKIENFFDLVAPNRRQGKPGVPGTYILDEASEYQSSHDVADGLQRMVQLGGNDGQSLVMACRFWKQLHRHVRQNADAVIAFRGIHDDTVREWSRSFDDRAEAVHRLTQHDFTILGERRGIEWIDDATSLSTYIEP